MSEVNLERGAGKLEAVRGTAESSPTNNLGAVLTLDPKQDYAPIDQFYGMLADSTADPILLSEHGEWESPETAIDTAQLPFELNLALKGGVSAPASNNKIAASVGSITGGSGYSPTNGTFVPLVSGGSPAVPATFLAHVTSGAITSVDVVFPGIGYASAPTLDFSPGGGSSGAATVTLSTPSSAKLWPFLQTDTADNLSSATLWGMDPNTQVYQLAFAMAESWNLSADASASKNAVARKMKGFSQFPLKVSAPSYPAGATPYGLVPKGMQLWMDAPGSPWGTTPITGRLVSAGLDVPTGVKMKDLANGPGSYGFTRVGREKTHKTLHLVFEFLDSTQYDLAVANGSVHGGVRQRVMCRWNGPLIETGFQHFFHIAMLGQCQIGKWGTLAGVNRTLAIDVVSSYDSGLGTSFAAWVQCLKTSV